MKIHRKRNVYAIFILAKRWLRWHGGAKCEINLWCDRRPPHGILTIIEVWGNHKGNNTGIPVNFDQPLKASLLAGPIHR